METSNNENDCKIQPINRDTVHRICSGQVVLTLGVAVKELVENAIDAGATNIEVRLKEYGSELIEVSDNGYGVRKEYFEALTLKHYTSKIREFSDLESIETLGFRGEALSSLCALSDLTVVTRHACAEHGTKIVYDHHGKIVSTTPTARQEGTTVTLANLFSTLPVRKTEFLKNLKREFSKMCQLLYVYCLVSKGVKFTCTNQTNKGSKNTVVCTEGSKTVRENIINVFGSKQISSLIDVEMATPDELLLKEYDVKLVPGEPFPFTFEFHISSAMHGYGRSSTDRQFYYVNSRPCEPTKVTKLVNEVYKRFNGNQYPFVYLNINFEKSQVDVNVTPDKRQIFVAKEKLLLAVLKASLLEAFKLFPSTYKIQNGGLSQVSQSFEQESEVSLRGLKRSGSSGGGIQNKSVFEAFKKKAKTEKRSLNSEDTEFLDEKPVVTRLTDLKNFALTSKRISTDPKQENSDVVTEITSCKLTSEKPIKEIIMDCSNDILDDKNATKFTNNSPKPKCSHEIESQPEMEPKYTLISLDEPKPKAERTSIPVKASIVAIREAQARRCSTSLENKSTRVKFRAEIAPEMSKCAESELQKQISKSMFKEMSIVGQFNHGFIVTKLENDLFIIDQHASDEKYNFEELQRTTVLENQKLVVPKPLELTAGNETLLIENEEMFNKNGFTFKIEHEAEATKKVFLTAIPISKNFVFGKDDIDEMLFMLQDDTQKLCRPSRVRAMFASRACRKSVMVGRPLTRLDMRKLVDHMGELDQPWNCPHGRPTMRHLVNLDLLQQT